MRRCPNCGIIVPCHDIYCHSCNRRIQQYFSISIFLKENFHLFTIIGVIGTMISVLPNIGEKILGPEWASGGAGVNFVAAIIFGCLFLFGVYAVTIRHILKDCRNEEQDRRFLILTLKEGDKSRILLILALTFMIFSFISYIFVSVLSIEDFYPLLTIFVFALLLMVAWTVYMVYDILKGIIDDLKNDRLGPVVIVVLFTIACFCVYTSLIPPAIAPINPSNVNIQSTPSFYSPLSSSDRGIFLSTTNTTYSKYKVCIYHWTANYGYFIDLKKMSDGITILGNETEAGNSIYWTYSSLDVEKEKPPVKIALEILDPTNRSLITKATLNITWFDKEIAKTF